VYANFYFILATQDMTELTYQVEWIRDIPNYDPSKDNVDVVKLYAVKLNGEKILVRSTIIATVKSLRSANKITSSRSDLSLLTEGNMLDVICQVGYDHFELCIGKMPEKIPGSRSVQFPASALDKNGSTSGDIM